MNPDRYPKQIKRPVPKLIKSNSLIQFLIILLFIIWTFSILKPYYIKSQFANWIKFASAVITSDKSIPLLSEKYQSDEIVSYQKGIIPADTDIISLWINHVLSFMLLILVLIINHSIGWTILETLKIKFTDTVELTVFTVTIGLCVLGYLIFILGILSLLYRVSIYMLIIILIVFSYIVINLLGSLSPQTGYDALVYHFTVPCYYLQNNSIKDIPFNIYSNFKRIKLC